MISLKARRVEPAETADKVTVVALSEFASREAMAYYDQECPAHKELKELIMGLGMSGKPVTMFWKDTVAGE